MLLKPEPLFEAVETLAGPDTHVVLLTPVGRPFQQALARELAGRRHLLLICGSYEGVDERVREALVDEELSIGDYVLTNGGLPAMIGIDAVTRLLPVYLPSAKVGMLIVWLSVPGAKVKVPLTGVYCRLTRALASAVA